MYHLQQNKCNPQRSLLLISKQQLILAVANSLAYNNISPICYCGQISLQSVAFNCIFFWQSDTFGGNIYFVGDGVKFG